MTAPRLQPAPDEDRRGLDALLVATAGGDADAFAELFEQVAPAVVGVARRVVRDPSMAEEVAQEALTDVWRTARRFDPDRGSAMTWVMVIAHRRAVDRVRSTQSARDRDTLVARRRERPFDETSEQVQDRAEAERVVAGLAELTELQREAIELAYFDGLTYREVAAVLDVPLGTVKTRMRDGLIRLRHRLGVP